jgi:hypothetical protein
VQLRSESRQSSPVGHKFDLLVSGRDVSGHSQDIADLWKQLAECQALAAEKCKDCDKKDPDWKPVPIPVPVPIFP